MVLGNGLNGHGTHLDGLTNSPNGRLNGFDDSDSEIEEYLDSSDLPEQVSHSSLAGWLVGGLRARLDLLAPFERI